MSSIRGWCVVLVLVGCGSAGGNGDSGTDASAGDGGELDGSTTDAGPPDGGCQSAPLCFDGGLPDAPPCERNFYRDADEDGFGDPSVSMLGPCDAPPAGFVENSEDCYDASSDAHPGQADHFATDRGDGSFDYDCDGSESLLYPDLHRCNMPPIVGMPGWCYAPVPSCGVSASYQSNASFCGCGAGRAQQRCR